MGLNQFQKTLDESTESQFEIDHGSVTTVVSVRKSHGDLLQVTITTRDNQPMYSLDFTPQHMFLEPDALEGLGRFLEKAGSSLRIRERESFVETIRVSMFDDEERQMDMFPVDDDHINLQCENLYRDVSDSIVIKQKMRSSKKYCRHFYATLCNNMFTKNNQRASYSWRSSGGFVADVLGEGDYLDWYCAGGEGGVDEEVAEDLKAIGWSVDEGYYDECLGDYSANLKQTKLFGENDEQK